MRRNETHSIDPPLTYYETFMYYFNLIAPGMSLWLTNGMQSMQLFHCNLVAYSHLFNCNMYELTTTIKYNISVVS